MRFESTVLAILAPSNVLAATINDARLLKRASVPIPDGWKAKGCYYSALVFLFFPPRSAC